MECGGSFIHSNVYRSQELNNGELIYFFKKRRSSFCCDGARAKLKAIFTAGSSIICLNIGALGFLCTEIH